MATFSVAVGYERFEGPCCLHSNSGLNQNQNVRTDNESYENVRKFKYLGTTLTYQNDIHDEIKSRKVD